MESVQRGLLFVISGPSGTGKGAICSGLREIADVELSVSMTTRAPREHEAEGLSYYFVTKEKFEKFLEADGFFEHADVYGEYYGTPKAPVLELLDRGKDVILEIDVAGAMQIKKSMPESVLVFIIPPSPEVLRWRIEHRGTETQERIAKRLEWSEGEISRVGEYDYCVVNDRLDIAIDDVLAIMHAEKLSLKNRDAEKIIERYHSGDKE